MAWAVAFAVLRITGACRVIRRGMAVVIVIVTVVVTMMVLVIVLLSWHVAVEVAFSHAVAMADLNRDIGPEGMHGANGQNEQGVDKTNHQEQPMRDEQAMNSFGWVKVIVDASSVAHL